MAKQLTALILIANFLFYFTTFSAACVPCEPKPPAMASPPPKPTPTPAPAPAPAPKCPKDYLKLAACVDLLGGLAYGVVGHPPSSKCCAVLQGLVDLEAALCLCTVIKANVLNIKVTVPVALSLLLSSCSKSVPRGFKC